MDVERVRKDPQALKLEDGSQSVRMARVEADRTAFKEEYELGHPAANAHGYVQLPNVDTLIEALDMKQEHRYRVYEANLKAARRPECRGDADARSDEA